MATELAKLKSTERKPVYGGWLTSEFELLSFFAGSEMGRCIKFNFKGNKQQLNLTRAEVEELTLELVKWLAS